MELTKSLTEEHELIKKAIDVLETAVNRLEKGASVEPAVFEQAVDFIRNFADRFHHAKEEDILFKEMVEKGMPEKDSPIEAMLTEHEQGRNFVKGIANATVKLKEGDKTAAKEIIKNANGYIELLREHIEKEDNILYPLAERIFTEDEKYIILDKFKKAELKKGGGQRRKYEDLVISLKSRLMGIPVQNER